MNVAVGPTNLGGFQFAVGPERPAKSSTRSADCYQRFGGGDFWPTIDSKPDFAPPYELSGKRHFHALSAGSILLNSVQ